MQDAVLEVGMVSKLVRYLREHAYGVDNAVPVYELCSHLGIPERELRDLRAEAEKEYPILSDQSLGYWYASCPEEVEEVRKKLKKLLVDNGMRMKRLKMVSRRAFVGQQMTMEV